MIQCEFVVKQMLWINQKGFLNYKRYYFFGGVGGQKQSRGLGPSTRLLRKCSQHLKDSSSISLERFDGPAYQGQVMAKILCLSFCEP